jgi:hypothetical protein
LKSGRWSLVAGRSGFATDRECLLTTSVC